MNRKFDVERLKELANGYIEIAKRSLLAQKSFPPVVVLVDPADESGDHLMQLNGDDMNDWEAKDKIADDIREQIRVHGYSGVLMLTDAYMLKLYAGKEKQWQFMKEFFGITNPQAAKMGLGELSERITVSAETVDGSGFVMSLEYKRNQKGEVVGFGENFTTDQPNDSACRFRFFNLDEASKLDA